MWLGTVHRDLSPGNVYYLEQRGGVLGDLEYAKDIATEQSNEVRMVRGSSLSSISVLNPGSGDFKFHVR